MHASMHSCEPYYLPLGCTSVWTSYPLNAQAFGQNVREAISSSVAAYVENM